jgi:hypothetical protein
MIGLRDLIQKPGRDLRRHVRFDESAQHDKPPGSRPALLATLLTSFRGLEKLHAGLGFREPLFRDFEGIDLLAHAAIITDRETRRDPPRIDATGRGSARAEFPEPNEVRAHLWVCSKPVRQGSRPCTPYVTRRPFAMAIFSLNHRPVGRSTHAPGTACAHARYITRESAMSELLGRVPDGYEMNRTGVMNWLHDGELTDRSNARVCDKFIVALPLELSPDERTELIRDFIREIGAENVGWAAAIHAKGEDDQNPHAHVIVRDRDLDTGKRVLGTSEKDSTQRMRVAWAEVSNRALERAGVEARIDHRSHAERGIEELPGIHLGPAAHMEERGIPTERGEHLRDIKAANHELREAYSAVREAEQIVRQAAEREPKRIKIKAFSAEIDAAEKELRAVFNAGKEAREGMREPEAIVRQETSIARDIRAEAEHNMREQLHAKNAGWFGLWRTSEQRAADTETKKHVSFTREKERQTQTFYNRPDVLEQLQRDYDERKTLVQQGDSALKKLMRISDARSSLRKTLEDSRFVGLDSLPEPQAKDPVQRMHEFERTARQELTRDDRAQQLQQREREREEQRRIERAIMRDRGPSISF